MCQLGTDFTGTAAGDLSGLSVALSTDGSRVAIGTSHDAEFSGSLAAGRTRVYEYSATGTWVQVGADIDSGSAEVNSIGIAVSLSGDGRRLAIGAVEAHARVYEDDNGRWVQIGHFDGRSGAHDGSSVSLSSDGSRLAVGAYSASGVGQTRVYAYRNGAWAPIGPVIAGEATGDWSGFSVSLSSDGRRVAIGAPFNGAAGLAAGHTRVYEDRVGAWVRLGADIDGIPYANSGWSVALAGDGGRVAIGAPSCPSSVCGGGYAHVYEYSGGAWVRVGAEITGRAPGALTGTSVSLSVDGGLLAVGASGAGAFRAGQSRVYRYAYGAWARVGADVNGQAPGDQSGRSVALSADGSRLAVGAPYNDWAAADAGLTRVYRTGPPYVGACGALPPMSCARPCVGPWPPWSRCQNKEWCINLVKIRPLWTWSCGSPSSPMIESRLWSIVNRMVTRVHGDQSTRTHMGAASV